METNISTATSNKLRKKRKITEPVVIKLDDTDDEHDLDSGIELVEKAIKIGSTVSTPFGNGIVRKL